jgi:hypothetical protein
VTVKFGTAVAPGVAALASTSTAPGGDVPLTAATFATLVTTPSLPAGTYLVSGQATIKQTGAVASDAFIQLNTGTATGTIQPTAGAQGSIAAAAGATIALAFTTTAIITVAGTLILRGFIVNAGTALRADNQGQGVIVTGLTTAKIG